MNKTGHKSDLTSTEYFCTSQQNPEFNNNESLVKYFVINQDVCDSVHHTISKFLNIILCFVLRHLR